MFILATIIAIVAALFYYHLSQKRSRTHQLADKFPGPPTQPIVGNIFNFSVKTNEETKNLFIESQEKYGDIYRIKIMHLVQFMTSDPKIYETIMSSNTKYLVKSTLYDFLKIWLGDGLLLSSGKKWHNSRKIITPAFHFKILEQFVDIFDQNSTILVKNLEKHADGNVIDINPFITLMALDIICETAMGTKINAQTDTDSAYVQAVNDITGFVSLRFSTMWKRSDFLYSIFARKEKQQLDKLIKTLHDFTDTIINKRREQLLNNNSSSENSQDDEFGINKKMAFLDVLLHSTIDGKPLSNEAIREEVDTIMFAGHDTTTAGVTFTLYLLSRHKDVQDKLFAELREVFGDDKTTPITFKQLHELKYLELVIKESLRMYPPAPVIARRIQEEIPLPDGKIIPADVNLGMVLFLTFRNPRYFKDPDTFNPERFNTESADEKINPYVYAPFSAGPRNCIGQKYAIFEMKTTLSKILRHYELLPRGEEPRTSIEVVLRSINGIQLGLKPRNYD